MTSGSARGGTRGRRARVRVRAGTGAGGGRDANASGGRGTCAVCLDAYVLPTTTRCGHVFCARCLQAALRHSSQCPTCRKKVTKSSCVRVFL
ncbi:Zinc finger, RING/FYVE/PHD-type [Ostreococcus tauri]|uniref:Zinc finger, RING/FYVE/PHD-type n=1 Tax=Ostreococcus tauri TaxID=70448 RepID=Q00Y70_OSTTA|nr:Zinc finger, RING/FYVE/PHD-type [Ostreococcus tauri]CAL57181.1 Zinc finger, RING/FYVE/PHD-type [Ostreococcus tauri]|eukprot:XP_003082235.1 Zinc finger, RING/FYVE/PHD-type [Ostreococcus tauri]